MSEDVTQGEVLPEENDAPLNPDDSSPSPADAAAEQPSESEPEEKSEEKQEDKGNKVQKRINDLTRQKYEALREKEALEKRLQDLEAKFQPTEPVKPKLEDFDHDTEAFEKAFDNYNEQKLEYQKAQQSRQSSRSVIDDKLAKEETERFTEYSQRMQAEKSHFQDFDSYVSDPTFDAICNAMPNEIIQAIRDSEQSTALTYHLASNLDDAERLVRMNPIKAAQELVRMESKLQAPKPKLVSDAPDPIKPTKSRGEVDKDPENMTTDEWLEWRRAQL